MRKKRRRVREVMAIAEVNKNNNGKAENTNEKILQP
jgi:hypothetical protein